MKNFRAVSHCVLLSIVPLIFADCDTPGAVSGPGQHRSSRYPSTWTDIDKWDMMWPAYAYARHGMLDEARKAVEAGEDTEFHYREGEQYYDYWSKHSEHADTGVRSDETMRDAANDVFNSNRNRLEEMKEKAANGDTEAQDWLRKYGAAVETGNDAAQRMNNQ